ncbi:RagB/SusD family nutrient uptake outer membrane protein [Pedobacter metabolipauper]|uniref:Putative outer membrane starch-binding protein n=1 Tax=Pedobacter metabolipauper TaxID=425513 RepID=A0A4R6SYD9_9SPHI|nr:RagB/SusD family nutrient uptake outer membrane protein [Pedobacter metabolipauper]TDQ11584.1 putative outer membrane starch-binding protein [Pedobacter metabolipauper]
MKKYIIATGILAMLTLGQACKKDSDFLEKQPTDNLSVASVWKDKNLVLTLVGDLYDRYPDYQNIEAWWDFTNFDEAFASAGGDYFRHQNTEYNYDSWNYWDYGFMREINLFIKRGGESTNLLAKEDTDRFLAEARFVRAGVYFELVKRMGGVPLLLEPLTYDYSGDPTPLRVARSKESEMYDFIIKEMEEIKVLLPDNNADPSRASKGAALALESRAALYAGSIAKYGAATPEVSLPGGEVGIPASMANGYYQIALRAAEEIITGGKYSLYKKNTNLQENFAALFIDKANPEVIFVKDYKLKTKKAHGFTIDNQPRSIAEEAQGGRLNPSLNLVQSFEMLDNSFAPLASVSGSNPIYYTNLTDIFAGRDARLGGTVILPGTQFKGKNIDIWAGYQLASGAIVTGTNFAEIKTNVLPGNTGAVQVVGGDGPLDGVEFSAQSGFYVRKFLDPAAGSGQIGTRSEVRWIRYRFAEVYLNAAEAAFELNNTAKAAGYLKEVRDRAGLTTALTAGQITFDRIVHERRVELAFEGHQLWDMKRWRLAHKVWNGTANTAADFTTATNIGSSEKVNTMVFGLWPYKYYAPGDPNDGKYLFKVVKPSRVTAAHRFRMGNYYSQFNQDILNGNPLIIRNPNQ